MLTLNDGRTELWQWDTGRKLTVDADCSQVHFSNKVFGRSIDVDVVDGVAIIPDILLQTDKDLNVWAFVGTAENGYTKISKVFEVNKRNKPADYVFTPLEQTTLGKIMERLDLIEENQDPDAIKNAVDDYLANNPIKVKETDPTVPDWAKQPEKPGYTAEEVGALSQNSLQTGIDLALAQAKESGLFDGPKGPQGIPGNDYVLTEADKQEIAQEAADLVDVPDKLPNPNALTFTGAVEGTYDGSAPMEIEIPEGGSGGSDEWVTVIDKTITLEEPTWDIVEDLGRTDDVKEYVLRIRLPITSEESKFSPQINGVSLCQFNGCNTHTSSNRYFQSFGNLIAPYFVNFNSIIDREIASDDTAKYRPALYVKQDGSGTFTLANVNGKPITGDVQIRLRVRY